ncbi:hypothetical protein Aduo_007778 [Ancylostoma duodenale]
MQKSEERIERLPEINVDERRFPTSLFGHQFAMDTTQDYNFRQLLKTFDNLEMYCDAPYESFYASTPNCSIDVSIKDALQFPQKISNRLPIEVGSTSREPTPGNVEYSWCRRVSHYFEWVCGAPELRAMDLRERIKLVTCQMGKIITLMTSFCTFQKGYDGIVLGCGICIKPQGNQGELLGDFATNITTLFHAHIISTFREMNVTRGEYLLLKAVALFQALHEYFPPADRLIVETASNKYRSALVSCIKCSHPELEHGVLLERVQALFGTLTYLEVMREFIDRYMADVVLENKGGMRGRLTLELHVNSNRAG